MTTTNIIKINLVKALLLFIGVNKSVEFRNEDCLLFVVMVIVCPKIWGTVMNPPNFKSSIQIKTTTNAVDQDDVGGLP